MSWDPCIQCGYPATHGDRCEQCTARALGVTIESLRLMKERSPSFDDQAAATEAELLRLPPSVAAAR